MSDEWWKEEQSGSYYEAWAVAVEEVGNLEARLKIATEVLEDVKLELENMCVSRALREIDNSLEAINADKVKG